MSASPILLLTGGGTAGHVSPNLALLPVLRERGFRVEYVGSHDGIERELCERAGLPYHAVHVGKLRRYASVQNLLDPFRTLRGILEARYSDRRSALGSACSLASSTISPAARNKVPNP